MDLIIQVAILIMYVSGIVLFWRYITQKANHQSPKTRLYKYRAEFVKEFCKPETDQLVRNLGIKSGLLYQIFRYIVLLLWLGLLIYKAYVEKMELPLPVVIWIAAFFISSPRRSFFHKDSPFLLLTNLIQSQKNQKLNREVFRCLSQLKNIAIAKSNINYSADSIICELAKYSVLIKPVFNRMLGYWYEGRYDEATTYFSESIRTKEAAALAGLLAKIDYLKPVEFVTQIELYQNSAKSERKTASQAAKENRSNLIYTLVIASGIIIIINFIVITIGVDYKLSNLFIF